MFRFLFVIQVLLLATEAKGTSTRSLRRKNHPSWFKRYRRVVGKDKLRHCKSQPSDGDSCPSIETAGDEYYCMFGEQTCDSGFTHPSIECKCVEADGHWSCKKWFICDEDKEKRLHEDIRTHTRQNKTAIQARYNKTAIQARYNKTAIHDRYNKTDIRGRYKKTAIHARYNKTAIHAKRNKTALLGRWHDRQRNHLRSRHRANRNATKTADTGSNSEKDRSAIKAKVKATPAAIIPNSLSFGVNNEETSDESTTNDVTTQEGSVTSLGDQVDVPNSAAGGYLNIDGGSEVETPIDPLPASIFESMDDNDLAMTQDSMNIDGSGGRSVEMPIDPLPAPIIDGKQETLVPPSDGDQVDTTTSTKSAKMDINGRSDDSAEISSGKQMLPPADVVSSAQKVKESIMKASKTKDDAEEGEDGTSGIVKKAIKVAESPLNTDSTLGPGVGKSASSALPEGLRSWPNMVGKTCRQARILIQASAPEGIHIVSCFHPGAEVVDDFRTDRVRIFLDRKGHVKDIPYVG